MAKGRGMLICLCVILLLQSPCFAASQPKKSVQEANNLYQRGKLDEALQKYNEASAAQPDSDIINFNTGAALYKKEDYKTAQEYFIKALTSDNKKVEADALYNLGNCNYKLGKLKENTDLSATVGLLRKSLDYYKRAVELDQKNQDARFNHEFVERELKVMLDKLKQQQAAQEKQEQQEQQKEELAQEQQQEKEKEGQEQAQQEEGEIAQGESQPSAPPRGEQENEDKELSEEEARLLLERYGQEEAAPDYIDRRAGGYEREVLKDW